MKLSKLKVEGIYLKDEAGNKVQLRGISTLGLHYPEYITKESFKTFRDEWGANVIRLAVYTYEPGGYCTDGDRKKLDELIIKGVEAATELSMYVIIDWHILREETPVRYKDEAIGFFDAMAERFGSYTNVIYEICNEPQKSPFGEVIRPYAEEVIPVIRKHSKDSLIIVGTNNWSQDVDEVIDQKCSDPNVMYALHFYAATHKDALIQKAQKALDGNVPIFISECSICEASGDGTIDYEMGQKWIDFADRNHISYVVWNLSNRDESSSLLRADAKSESHWKDEEYSDTAVWFKKVMSDKKDS